MGECTRPPRDSTSMCRTAGLGRMVAPRLGLLPVIGVGVIPDLREATVFYSALIPAEGETGHDPAGAPRWVTPRLQAAMGGQVRMKYTPLLVFREDPAIR